MKKMDLKYDKIINELRNYRRDFWGRSNEALNQEAENHDEEVLPQECEPTESDEALDREAENHDEEILPQECESKINKLIDLLRETFLTESMYQVRKSQTDFFNETLFHFEADNRDPQTIVLSHIQEEHLPEALIVLAEKNVELLTEIWSKIQKRSEALLTEIINKPKDMLLSEVLNYFQQIFHIQDQDHKKSKNPIQNAKAIAKKLLDELIDSLTGKATLNQVDEENEALRAQVKNQLEINLLSQVLTETDEKEKCLLVEVLDLLKTTIFARGLNLNLENCRFLCTKVFYELQTILALFAEGLKQLNASSTEENLECTSLICDVHANQEHFDNFENFKKSIMKINKNTLETLLQDSLIDGAFPEDAINQDQPNDDAIFEETKTASQESKTEPISK
ncbi:hypothetical protein TKK_0013179 [Trichogramma kaykai]